MLFHHLCSRWQVQSLLIYSVSRLCYDNKPSPKVSGFQHWMLISSSCCIKAAMRGLQGLYATHPAVWRSLTWLRAPVLDTLVLQRKRMLVLRKSVMHFWSTLAGSHAGLVMPWQRSATYNLHGRRCYNSKATGGNVDSSGEENEYWARGGGTQYTLPHPACFPLFLARQQPRILGISDCLCMAEWAGH